MQSHELLREVFQETSPKQVADDLSLSLSMIYKWAQPSDEGGSGTQNPLDRIEQLLQCTKDDRVAQWVAQESDIYFMDEPFAGVDAATESAIVTLMRELKDKGKTLLVVHHDLPTAKEYFDMLLLLNMRVVAFGPTEEVFNVEMLQKTYGGRLTILSEVAEAVKASKV